MINWVRYTSQFLMLSIGSIAILLFGLMCPVIGFFNPILAIASFVFAVVIAFVTVEAVDQIDVWVDKRIYG